MTRRTPLLPLAVGFAAGALLRIAAGPSLPVWPAVLLAPFRSLAPVAMAAAGYLGIATATATPTPAPAPMEQLEGTVASVPERLEGRVRFLLREPSGRLVQASAPPSAWPIAWGDRVRFQARTWAPDGARNPGGRDGALLLALRGVATQASATTPPLRTAPPAPLSWLEAGRTRFAEAAGRALPPAEAALLRSIGAGDRSALEPATTEAFARSGLIHLLSVSGLHLAVVALGGYRLLRALLLCSDWVSARADARRTAAALALPLTGAYALATGADVPVVRSALAAGLGFAGVLLDRESSALGALSLGLLAVLAVEPGAVLDVSLQLSFASVAGLALLTRPLRECVPWQPGPGRAGRAVEWVLTGLAAGAAAGLATAPLVAFHFRRLSLLAPAANLAGVPLGSAITVLGALAAPLSAIAPALALPLLWAAWPFAWLLLRVNSLFAAPGIAAVGVASPGPLGLAACGVGLWGAVALQGRWRAAAALLAAVGLLLPGPLRARAAAGRGLLEVVFVSVGQGDSTFLRLPDGAAVLVDGGGDPFGHQDPGRRDVLPILRDAGVRRLWLAALSHPHPDHLAGLASVASELEVERLATGPLPSDLLLPAAREHRVLRPGDALERAGVRLRALGPPPGAEAWSENDASLVLRVEHGGVAILLLGDVEEEGEAALLASGAPLGAQVVKVPHHGARTSSTPGLVAATRPDLAVISVGRRNRFGFPAPEVVARWEAAGAQVLRTDGGAVRLLSDGERIWQAPAEGALDAWALWREGATPTSASEEP
ncbi:MAG: DNA internalization-related competence protein ComEC/Rec2 [Deltaproteobacteria bacterium]|nr:DNA internalization-related competence protein ComEC/Rec2 [Deltaproteobacteria bacterium]